MVNKMNVLTIILTIFVLLAWISYDTTSFEYWNMLLWSISAIVGFIALYEQLEQNNKLIKLQLELLEQNKLLHDKLNV